MADGKAFEVVFVRHAKAGSRSAWQGDDQVRPLTSAGRKQANALVKQLRDAKFARIISSPFKRCVETVEPLAHEHGLAVEDAPVLAEGQGLAAFLALVDEVGVDALYCGHGDLLYYLLESLVAEKLIKAADARLEKGSVWILKRRKQRFRAARYLAPPA